ncbi:hypothetical protein UPYG_G00060860 [Umbra pygmaea]|uniref:Glucagon receptor n=1 Tax=Umbra pygmaea TaxID=75934 RepID=A0ABD0XU63_UMBPY
MSLVCSFLALLMLFSCTQVSSARALKQLMEKWTEYKNNCSQSFVSAAPATGLVCNRTFDQYACWPDGLPGTTVNVSCPQYLPWYHKVQQGLVFRVCGADGSWAPKNTSECEQDDPEQYYGSVLRKFRAMYTVGYSLSLGSLVLALGILASFRKLHCMRNNIHMNLFASFILRAASILIKDALMDTPSVALTPGADTHHQTVAGCRIAMVMMQYSVIANNYWLLVEGIYLHSLLVITVFTERNYFNIYLFIGWGTPLIFVLPWVTMKNMYENEQCWERNVNMGYWWIIRSPIVFSYLINFFIFIRIIKILMSKLKAHQMRYTDYKFRLAKSTLTLIPLLGIHAILFTFVIDESVPKGSMMRLIRLFYDLLFNSFQGLLVAILYCFVNKEVQCEMLKRWRRWKLGKDLEEEYRHTYSHTAQFKRGSNGTGNLTDQRDNDSDHNDSQSNPNPNAYLPSTSTTLDESSRLVVSCQNGKSKEMTKPVLQCHSTPCVGALNSSSLAEDICLEEMVRCSAQPEEGSESNF